MKLLSNRSGLLAVLVLLVFANLQCRSVAGVSPTPAVQVTANDNAELAQLHAEDQADRRQAGEVEIDWELVEARDTARRQRVLTLYRQNELTTGSDYFHAAMVLQHGLAPEDYLLAHELSVVAMSKGHEGAKWLAAASQDRFLRSIGRPQRFGTQFGNRGAGTPMRLYDIDEAITDELRRQFNVPSLARAREREAELNRGIW